MSPNFYVPQMVFIDKKGVIRAQYGGTDPFLGDQQEANMRGMIEQLLAEPGGRNRRPTQSPREVQSQGRQEGIVDESIFSECTLLACAIAADVGGQRCRGRRRSSRSRCRKAARFC